MSRGGDYESYENFPNEGEFWAHRARTALKSKRGRKALTDLREALFALPEHRLISRALCTVGTTHTGNFGWRREYIEELVGQQGPGVCAVGAYAWHQRVKAGVNPDEAMRSLPMLDDDAYTIDDTAQFGEAAGMTYTLAWVLADQNDETYRDATPEQRWEQFVAWIDRQLASTP